MLRCEEELIKPSFSKLRNNRSIGKVTKRISTKKKELLRIVNQEYNSYISVSIAEALSREIVETASYNEQTPEYVQEIREKLFILHDYNTHVAKVSYSYPISKETYILLGKYVELECHVLYKNEYNIKYEKYVEDRVFQCVVCFLKESISTEDDCLQNRKDVFNEALKIFVSYVDARYIQDEDKFPAKIVKNILDVLGLIKKTNDNPDGNLDVNNPSLIRLKESLKDSDYGSSDDDGQETASVLSEPSFRTMLFKRNCQKAPKKEVSSDSTSICEIKSDMSSIDTSAIAECSSSLSVQENSFITITTLSPQSSSLSSRSTKETNSGLKPSCESKNIEQVPNFPSSNEVFSISKDDIQRFIENDHDDDDIALIEWNSYKCKFPQPRFAKTANTHSIFNETADRRNKNYRIHDTISIVSSDEEDDFENKLTDFDSILSKIKEQKRKSTLLNNLRNITDISLTKYHNVDSSSSIPIDSTTRPSEIAISNRELLSSKKVGNLREVDRNSTLKSLLVIELSSSDEEDSSYKNNEKSLLLEEIHNTNRTVIKAEPSERSFGVNNETVTPSSTVGRVFCKSLNELLRATPPQSTFTDEERISVLNISSTPTLTNSSSHTDDIHSSNIISCDIDSDVEVISDTDDIVESNIDDDKLKSNKFASYSETNIKPKVESNIQLQKCIEPLTIDLDSDEYDEVKESSLLSDAVLNSYAVDSKTTRQDFAPNLNNSTISNSLRDHLVDNGTQLKKSFSSSLVANEYIPEHEISTSDAQSVTNETESNLREQSIDISLHGIEDTVNPFEKENALASNSSKDELKNVESFDKPNESSILAATSDGEFCEAADTNTLRSRNINSRVIDNRPSEEDVEMLYKEHQTESIYLGDRLRLENETVKNSASVIKTNEDNQKIDNKIPPKEVASILSETYDNKFTNLTEKQIDEIDDNCSLAQDPVSESQTTLMKEIDSSNKSHNLRETISPNLQDDRATISAEQLLDDNKSHPQTVNHLSSNDVSNIPEEALDYSSAVLTSNSICSVSTQNPDSFVCTSLSNNKIDERDKNIVGILEAEMVPKGKNGSEVTNEISTIQGDIAKNPIPQNTTSYMSMQDEIPVEVSSLKVVCSSNNEKNRNIGALTEQDSVIQTRNKSSGNICETSESTVENLVLDAECPIPKIAMSSLMKSRNQEDEELGNAIYTSNVTLSDDHQLLDFSKNPGSDLQDHQKDENSKDMNFFKSIVAEEVLLLQERFEFTVETDLDKEDAILIDKSSVPNQITNAHSNSNDMNEQVLDLRVASSSSHTNVQIVTNKCTLESNQDKPRNVHNEENKSFELRTILLNNETSYVPPKFEVISNIPETNISPECGKLTIASYEKSLSPCQQLEGQTDSITTTPKNMQTHNFHEEISAVTVDRAEDFNKDSDEKETVNCLKKIALTDDSFSSHKESESIEETKNLVFNNADNLSNTLEAEEIRTPGEENDLGNSNCVGWLDSSLEKVLVVENESPNGDREVCQEKIIDDDESTSFVIDEGEYDESAEKEGGDNVELTTMKSELEMCGSKVQIPDTIFVASECEVVTSGISTTREVEITTGLNLVDQHLDVPNLLDVQNNVEVSESLKSTICDNETLFNAVSKHEDNSSTTNSRDDSTKKHVDTLFDSSDGKTKPQSSEFTPKAMKNRCSDSHNVVGNLGKVMLLVTNNEPRRLKRNISFTSPTKVGDSCSYYDKSPTSSNKPITDKGTKLSPYKSYSANAENTPSPKSTQLKDTTFSHLEKNAIFPSGNFYSPYVPENTRDKEVLYNIKKCDPQKQHLDIDILASVASNRKPLKVNIPKTDELQKISEQSSLKSKVLSKSPSPSSLKTQASSAYNTKTSPSKSRSKNSKKSEKKKDSPSSAPRKAKASKNAETVQKKSGSACREDRKSPQKVRPIKEKRNAKESLPEQSRTIEQDIGSENELVIDCSDSDDSLPLDIRMKKVELLPQQTVDARSPRKERKPRQRSKTQTVKREKSKKREPGLKKRNESYESHFPCKEDLEGNSNVNSDKPEDKQVIVTSPSVKEDPSRRIVHFKKAILEMISQDLDEHNPRNELKNEPEQTLKSSGAIDKSEIPLNNIDINNEKNSCLLVDAKICDSTMGFVKESKNDQHENIGHKGSPTLRENQLTDDHVAPCKDEEYIEIVDVCDSSKDSNEKVKSVQTVDFPSNTTNLNSYKQIEVVPNKKSDENVSNECSAVDIPVTDSKSPLKQYEKGVGKIYENIEQKDIFKKSEENIDGIFTNEKCGVIPKKRRVSIDNSVNKSKGELTESTRKKERNRMDNKIDKNEKETKNKHKKKEKLIYDKNKSEIDPIHKTSNDIAIETKVEVPSTSSIELLSKNESTPPKSRRKSRSTSRHKNSPTDDKKTHLLNDGKQYNEIEKHHKSSSIKLKTGSSSVSNENEHKTKSTGLELSPNKHKKDVSATKDLVKEHTQIKRKTRTLYDTNRDVPKADHTNENRDEEMKAVATNKAKELRIFSEGQTNKVAYVKLDRYKPEYRSDEELKKRTRKLKRKRSKSNSRERKSTIEKVDVKKKDEEAHDSKLPRGESKSQGRVNSRKYKKKSTAKREIADKNTEKRKHKSHDKKPYKNVSGNSSNDHAKITDLEQNLPSDEKLSSTLRKNKDNRLCASETNNSFNENKQKDNLDNDEYLVSELKVSGSESCGNEVAENISKSNYENTESNVSFSSNMSPENEKSSPNENGRESTCLRDDKLVKENTASNVEILAEEAIDVTVIPSIRNEVFEEINTHAYTDFIAEKNTPEKLDIIESEKIIHSRIDAIENETNGSSNTSVNEQILVNVPENAGVKKVASNEEKCSRNKLDSNLPIEPVIIQGTDPQLETLITDNIKISNVNTDIEERKPKNMKDMEANTKEEKNYEKFAPSKLDSKFLIEPEVIKKPDPLPDSLSTDKIETSNGNTYIKEIKHKNIKDLEANTKEENLKIVEIGEHNDTEDKIVVEKSELNIDRLLPQVCDLESPLSPDPDSQIDGYSEEEKNLRSNKQKNPSEEFSSGAMFNDVVVKFNSELPNAEPEKNQDASKLDANSDEGVNRDENISSICMNEIKKPKIHIDYEQGVSHAKLEDINKGKDSSISCIISENIEYDESQNNEMKIEPHQQPSKVVTDDIDEKMISQNPLISKIDVEEEKTKHAIQSSQVMSMNTEEEADICYEIENHLDNVNERGDVSSDQIPVIKFNDPPTATNVIKDQDRCLKFEPSIVRESEKEVEYLSKIPEETVENIDENQVIRVDVSSNEGDGEFLSEIGAHDKKFKGEEESPNQKFKPESCSVEDKIEVVNSKNTIEETDGTINEHGINQAMDKVLQAENENPSLHIEVLASSDNLENIKNVGQIPSLQLEICTKNEISQSSGAELESEQAQSYSKLSNDDIGSNLTVHQNVMNEVETFTSHERELLESQAETQLSEVVDKIPEEDVAAHQDKNADHNVSTSDNDNSEQERSSERSQDNFQDDEVVDQNAVLDMLKPYNPEPEPTEADQTGRITQLEIETEKTEQILHLETGFPKTNSIKVELKVQSSGLPEEDLVPSLQSEIYQDDNNVAISHVEYRPEILEAATDPNHNLEIIETSEPTETELIIVPRDDPPSSKIEDSRSGDDTVTKNLISDLLPVCKEMEHKDSELNTELDLLNSPRKINVENANSANIVEYEVQVAKVFFSNDEEEAESGSIAKYDGQLRSEDEDGEIIPPPACKDSEIPKDIDVEEKINEHYQINSEVKEIHSNLELDYVTNTKEGSPKSKRKREDELDDIKEPVLIKKSNIEIENTIFSSQKVVDNNIVMNTMKVHSEESRITFEEHMDQERILNEDILGRAQNKLEMSNSEYIQFEQHISANIPTEIQRKIKNHGDTHNQQYLQQSKIENAAAVNTRNVVEEANDLISTSDGKQRCIYEQTTVSKEQEPKATKSTDQTHHLENSSTKNKLSFSIERMLQPSYQIEQNPPVENTVGIMEPTASTSNLEINEVACFKRPEDVFVTNLKCNTKKKQRKKHEIVKEKPDPAFENRKVVVEKVYSMDELSAGIDINPCLNLCSAPFVPISNECIPYRYGVYGTIIPTLGRNESHLQSTVPCTVNESAPIPNIETHNSLPWRETKRRMSSKKESGENKTVEPRNIHSTMKPENDIEIVEIDINQKKKSEVNMTECVNEMSQKIDSNIHQNEMPNCFIASKNDEIVDKKANSYSPSNNVHVENNQPNINETNLQQTFSSEISASDNVVKKNTESTTSLLVSKEKEKIDDLQFNSVTPSDVLNEADQSKTLSTNQLNLNSVKSNVPDHTFLPSLSRQLIPESEEIQLTYNMGHVEGIPRGELNTIVGTHEGPQTMSNIIETSKEILSHDEVSHIYNSSLEPLSNSFGDKAIDGSSASEGMESYLNSFQSAISDSMTHSLPSIQEIEDFSNEKLNLVQSTPMRLEETQQPHDPIINISDIFCFDLTIFENLLYNLNNVGCEVTVDNTNAEDVNGDGGLTQEQLNDSIPSYIPEEFDSTDPMVGGQKELVSDSKQDSNLDEAPLPESALSFDDDMIRRYASLLDCDDPSPQQCNSDEPSQIGNSRETSDSTVLQRLPGTSQLPESAIGKIDGSNVENTKSTEVLEASLSFAQEVSILHSDDISCLAIEAKGGSTISCNSTVNEQGGHALLQNQEIDSFNKTTNISETYTMAGDQIKLIPDSKQDYNLVEAPFQDRARVLDAKMMHPYASTLTEQDSNPHPQHQDTKKPINKATRISKRVIADKPEVDKKGNRKSSARVLKIPASKYAPPKKLQSNETLTCKKQPEKVPIKQPNNSNTEKQAKPLSIDTGVKHSLDMPQLLSPTENTFWRKNTSPSSCMDKNETKSKESEDHLNEVNETHENVTESDFIFHTQYNMYDRTKAMKRNAAKIENYSKFYDDDARSLNRSRKQKIVTKTDKTEDHPNREKRSSTLQQDNLEMDESTRSKRLKLNESFPDTNNESAAYRYEPPSRDSLHVDLDDEFDRLKKSGPFKSSASKSSKGTRIDRILRNAQEEHHQIPTISSQYKHGDRGRRVDGREYVDNYRRTEDYKRRTKGEERSRSPYSRSRTHVSTSSDHRRESSKRSIQEMTRSDSSYSRECQSSLDDRRRTPLEGHYPNDFHKKADRSQKKSSPRYHQHLFNRPYSSQSKKKPYDYGGKEWYEQLNEKFPLDKDVYHNKGH